MLLVSPYDHYLLIFGQIVTELHVVFSPEYNLFKATVIIQYKPSVLIALFRQQVFRIAHKAHYPYLLVYKVLQIGQRRYLVMLHFKAIVIQGMPAQVDTDYFFFKCQAFRKRPGLQFWNIRMFNHRHFHITEEAACGHRGICLHLLSELNDLRQEGFPIHHLVEILGAMHIREAVKGSSVGQALQRFFIYSTLIHTGDQVKYSLVWSILFTLFDKV
ncbi:hypothetical protein D3C72_887840 [compost metagenome]